MKRTKPELSVVILCYKSGEFAKVFSRKVIDALNRGKLNYEIILVANSWPGSGDITPRVVKEIVSSSKRVKGVYKLKKKPYHNMGWDMKHGLAASSGETVAIIDGDGQISARDILKIYKKLKKEKLDLCKIKRISRKDGIYRQTISHIYNMLMFILFPGIKSDVNGKPKVFTQDVYKKLKLSSNDWFIDAEIMIKARRLKLKVGEINGGFRKNPERKSFITFAENF